MDVLARRKDIVERNTEEHLYSRRILTDTEESNVGGLEGRFGTRCEGLGIPSKGLELSVMGKGNQ